MLVVKWLHGPKRDSPGVACVGHRAGWLTTGQQGTREDAERRSHGRVGTLSDREVCGTGRNSRRGDRSRQSKISRDENPVLGRQGSV